MSVRVTLTRAQVSAAERIGKKREQIATSLGWAHNYGFNGRYPNEPHMAGAAAEQAVALCIGVEWKPSLEPDKQTGDVGKAQVRSTPRVTGSLILHDDDPDEAPFILVTGKRPNLVVRCWCYGREGKLPEYWRTDTGRPAFFVPQRSMRDFETDRRRKVTDWEGPTCATEAHRVFDWRVLSDRARDDNPGIWVCGLCHPCVLPSEWIEYRAATSADVRLAA